MPTKETAQVGKAQEDVQYFETGIIGSGFSGLLAAIRLQKKHCNDFVLLERSSELGGTWQVNSYPGAEVDIPTSLYSISFIAYPFRKTFSPQSELLAYTNHIIDKFCLRKQAKTNQTVTRLTYDESAFLWHVETESGERYSARFIIDTSGVLANPHIPNIKGAETFEGPIFHTGHWDHAVAYEGKRVGVIGSGCSGAQIVPAIADKVSRLTLFMGKAQWILPRSDRNYSALERFVRTLPGIRHLIRLWEKEAVSYKGITVSGYPNYFKVNGPNTGTGHSSQISYMQVAADYIVQAISAVKRYKSIRAINAKQGLQDAYVAEMREKMKKTVWQNATCTAFYRKNMTEEVTSLSPEPVTGFIFSRKWFNLSDYHLLK